MGYIPGQCFAASVTEGVGFASFAFAEYAGAKHRATWDQPYDPDDGAEPDWPARFVPGATYAPERLPAMAVHSREYESGA